MPVNRLFLLLGLLVVLACLTTPSRAAMSCTATIGDLDFGSIDVLANTAVSSFSNVSISCSGATPNTTYRFCGNAAAGPDYTTGQRNMASSANLLKFGLYVDSGRTVPYGNYVDPIFGGGYQFDLTSNGSGQIAVSGAMYGSVPANQTTAIPGSYSEFFAPSSSNSVRYGAVPANGGCPVGPSAYQVSFTIRATVPPKCTIGGGTLDFGSTGGTITSAVLATGTVTAKCTRTTPFSIGLGDGSNASGTQRRMRLGATSSYVDYNLYTDAARTQAWRTTTAAGSCSGGAGSCYLGTGDATNQVITVYGALPVQTVPNTGSYSDMVVVNITY